MLLLLKSLLLFPMILRRPSWSLSARLDRIRRVDSNFTHGLFKNTYHPGLFILDSIVNRTETLGILDVYLALQLGNKDLNDL